MLHLGLRVTDLDRSLAFYTNLGYTEIGRVPDTPFGSLTMLKLPEDPFVSLDQEGVGDLIRIATERGRGTRGDVKLGICGEHGGDPASIAFCEAVGLDYVSCSPYRTPIARLAAAHAALAAEKGD